MLLRAQFKSGIDKTLCEIPSTRPSISYLFPKNGCGAVFTKWRAFLNHLYRRHNQIPNEMKMHDDPDLPAGENDVLNENNVLDDLDEQPNEGINFLI